MNFALHRRHTLLALATAAAAAGIALPAHAQSDEAGTLRHGKVFISTNAPAGNEVLVYARNTAAAPTFVARFATQGAGTGAGLGSQGAVTLSRDGQFLFVVNAASNSLSTFSLAGGTMTLASVVSSGGTTPISVTERNGLVYVLNAGGDGNVSGFSNSGGVLAPLADGLRGLSAAGGTGPAQVSFNTFGDVLVVSEKNTNRLTSWSVQPDGRLSRPGVTPTPGAVPFGFAFTANDTLVVSEAAGSDVSSFRFVDNSRIDAPRAATSALANGQAAACWVAVTPGGHFAYTGNAGTSNVSAYSIARDGRVSLLAAVAGSNGAGAGALDLAVSPDGAQLLSFASRTPQIVAFTISPMGALTSLGAVGGMPLGSAGLAAN
jgi:6-phosphogluconolactonase (cycloisomerase 2 family)